VAVRVEGVLSSSAVLHSNGLMSMQISIYLFTTFLWITVPAVFHGRSILRCILLPDTQQHWAFPA
jgi:hypothetical protein